MTKRERWLRHRRSFITATDVPKILGLSSFKSGSKLTVYLDKIGLSDYADDERKRWGRRLESVIADGFEEDTGRDVEKFRQYELVEHPDIKILAATPDRGQSVPSSGCKEPPTIETSGEGTLEIKNSTIRWKENAPEEYNIQLQVQMSCMRRSWGTVCELHNGSSLLWEDISYDESFIKAAIEELEKFWWHVQNKVPPEPSIASDLDAVKRLYAQSVDSQEKPLELPETADELILEWEVLREKIASSKADRALLEAKIRALLGESTHAVTKAGGVLIGKETSVKGYTKVMPPSKHRKLVWHPLKEAQGAGRIEG